MLPLESNERLRASASALLGRAFCAAVLVAAFRAALVGVRFAAEPGGTRLALAAVSSWLLVGGAIAIGPAWIAAWLGRRGGAVAWGALLLAALLGFLFATHRLPIGPAYAPGLETPRALASNAVGAAAACCAALFLSPWPRWPRVVAGGAMVLAAIAMLAAGGYAAIAERAQPASWPKRPNVIVLSLDTLRADRLGCYGYERETSPELDRFADNSLRFDNAFSQAPWTLTSHMTLFTALHPAAHGVDKDRALPPEIPTLAELLSAEGWRTVAVVDKQASWLDRKFGFDRGFEIYRQVRGHAEVKVDHVLSVLDEVEGESFFLFAHFFDVHSDNERLPYESDPEDYAEFAGWYEGPFDGCGESGLCASERLVELNDTRTELGEEEKRYLSDLYDAGIRSLDRQVGRLLNSLEERGLFENTIVLITSDHGEEFAEHGRWLHTQFFDECLHVPFLLRTPDVEPGSREALAGLVDVTPTVLELTGLPPLDMHQGRSLVPLLQTDGTVREHLTFSGEGLARGLRSGPWLLMTGGRMGWRLFDRVLNPAQTRDFIRSGDWPEGTAELIGSVKSENNSSAELRQRFSGIAVQLDDAEREALEALGYLGD